MLTLSVQSALDSQGHEGNLIVSAIRPLTFKLRTLASEPIRFDVPPESARAISLAYVLLMTDVPMDDELDFPGASLWLSDWNIWGEGSDRVGMTLLTSLRSEQTDWDLVAETPVMLFDAREFARAHAALALALVFHWDAYLVPQSRQFIAFISHDGLVELQASSTSVRERLVARFSRGGWLDV